MAQSGSLLSLLQSLPAEARSQLNALLAGGSTPVRRSAPCWWLCHTHASFGSHPGGRVWRPAPAPACPLVPHAHGPRRLCLLYTGPHSLLWRVSCSLAGLDTTQVAVQPGASAHAQAAGGAQQWHRTAAGKAATQRRFVTLLNALARGEGSEHAQTEAVYEEVRAGVAGRARWQCC
jgi:hypothetical protein